MNILIVVATEQELSGKPGGRRMGLMQSSYGKHSVDILITGVGMVATAYMMGKHIASSKKKYHLAINAGIAGSFNGKLKIGDVVNITSDRFSELGAEDGEKFISAEKLGFAPSQPSPKGKGTFRNKVIQTLPSAKGITVNTVHGNAASIKKIIARLKPDVESMEGAAFMQVCSDLKIPCFQIRAISNYVERRNKKNWNIPLAIKNLNKKLIEIIISL